MAQQIKDLVCKQKDPSLNLRTHVKLGAVAHVCKPSVPTTRWEAEKENPQTHGPLAWCMQQ